MVRAIAASVKHAAVKHAVSRNLERERNGMLTNK
jgi:hypothetical protein